MFNWDLFFKENEKKAYVIALNYIRNTEDALDVVQDSMISMYKNYSHIESTEEARPLFYKILNNKLTDKYRSLKRIWNRFVETPENLENLILVEDKNDNDLLKLLEMSVKDLTKVQQKVFLLKTIEEFTYKEISLILSISESSCKTHYTRAIKKIQESVN